MSEESSYPGQDMVHEFSDDFIDRLAKYWPEPRDQLHAGGWKATQELIGLLEIRAGDTILDVCCGEGATAVYLSRKFPVQVVGIDLLFSAVKQGHLKSTKEDPPANDKFIQGNLFTLPLPEGSFHIVYGQDPDGLAHQNKEKAFREIFRVLKPGGKFGFQHWIPGIDAPGEITSKFDAINREVGYQSHDQVHLDAYLDAMKKAGFKRIKTIDKSEMYLSHMSKIQKLMKDQGEKPDPWLETWLSLAERHPFGVMVVARK